MYAQPTSVTDPNCGFAYIEPDCAGPFLGMSGYPVEFEMCPTCPDGAMIGPPPGAFVVPQPVAD